MVNKKYDIYPRNVYFHLQAFIYFSISYIVCIKINSCFFLGEPVIEHIQFFKTHRKLNNHSHITKKIDLRDGRETNELIHTRV